MWFTLEEGKIGQERKGEVDPFFSLLLLLKGGEKLIMVRRGKKRGVTQIELERELTSQIK